MTQEETEAKKWRLLKQTNEGAIGAYEPKVLTEQHFSFIKRFYEEVMPDQQSLSFKKMYNTVAKLPVELINNWIQRLDTHLSDLKQEKADKISEWKQLCETNFFKSLDHRSFFFKKEQKDLLP